MPKNTSNIYKIPWYKHFYFYFETLRSVDLLKYSSRMNYNQK